jgi:hypothetical protein
MDDEADDGERTSRKPGHDERCGQSGSGMLTRTRSMRLRHVECTAKPREPGPGCGSAGRGRARFGDACRTFGRTSVKGTMKLNGRSRFARTYGRGRRRGGGLLRSRRPRGRAIAPVKRRPHGRKVLHRGVSAENGAVAGSGANLQARLVCLVRSRRRLTERKIRHSVGRCCSAPRRLGRRALGGCDAGRRRRVPRSRLGRRSRASGEGVA